MSFGQPQHEDLNALLNARFKTFGKLIVVHRGTPNATIAENTSAAVVAAVASGADIVEIDAIQSTDGEFFTFHGDNELRLCGTERSITAMSASEIDTLSYIWVSHPGRTVRVERLLPLLAGFRGSTLFNIDRSWAYWASLLPKLAQLSMAQQLLLKAPAWLPEAIDVLRIFPTKFPFMPICKTLEEAECYLSDPELNTVGLELIAKTPDSPLFDQNVISTLRAQGVFVCVNAEVLSTGEDLWAGLDDEVSVLDDPAKGWGVLFERYADAVITDWPWLVRGYRENLE